MYLLRTFRNALVLIVLVLTVLLTRPDAERYGDNLQIALPLAGLGCAVLTGGAGEYFLRFTGAWIVLHSSKRGLGEPEFNLRPGGGGHGFPSGHTTAAVFGASALVNECLTRAPLVKTAVIVAAGFTGASRIEAGAHDIWQVLAGVLLGLFFERVLRGKSRARQAVTDAARSTGGAFRRLVPRRSGR